MFSLKYFDEEHACIADVGVCSVLPSTLSLKFGVRLVFPGMRHEAHYGIMFMLRKMVSVVSVMQNMKLTSLELMSAMFCKLALS